MVSPWLPRVSASTSSTSTPAFSAMKWAKRALSRFPAWPITRCRGNPDTSAARVAIWSKGLVTTIITASGERSTTCSVTSLTIVALTWSRSIRLIPGLRGSPAVITTTSLPAVAA